MSWSIAPAGNALKAAAVGAKTVNAPSLFRLVSNPADLSRSSRIVKLPLSAATSTIVPSALAVLGLLDVVPVVAVVEVTGAVLVTVVVEVTGAVALVVAVVVTLCVRVTVVLAAAAGALVGAGVGWAEVVAPVPKSLRAGN